MTKPARSLPRAARRVLADFRRLGQRAWQGARGGRSAARHRGEGAWSGRLADEKEVLLALVRGMETEFLATGAGLMRLAQQLNAIQKDCQSLTDLTLGKTPDPAVQFAFQLLKKSEDLVLSSYEQYDHVFVMFGELQARMARLAKQYSSLMRVLAPLNFITVGLRIEASRHPPDVQQAFMTLAANMNQTVSKVRSTLEKQFEALAASEQIAGSLMKEVSDSVAVQRKAVSATLGRCRAQLKSLGAALDNSGAEATDLSNRNQAVTRHVGAIVMAQQCQDITRQRIEHVGEAMDEMRAQLDEAAAAPGTAPSEARAFIFQAGQIQLQQAQNVFAQLNQAAGSLTSGIQNLRTEAGAAAATAVKVGGTMADAKFASQCQAGIGEILALVHQAVRSITDILAAFAPLQARFVDCTTEASELANDVRHAALNAQIFAIHAVGGAPLEVLAGRVRIISDETITQVDAMSAELLRTAAIVNDLKQRLEGFQQLGQAEQEILTVESTWSQSKLADLEAAIPVLIGRITRQQETFVAATEAILADVQFPLTVAETSARSLGFFEDLVKWGGEGNVGMAAGSAGTRKLERLKAGYTMDSERLAHTAAMKPAAAVAVVAVAAAVASDLASDFELFTSDPPAPVGPESPGNVATSAPALAAPALAPGLEKSAEAAALGDNVDLF